MTQSDKWRRRPCVVKYHEFKDFMRLQALSSNFILPDEFRVTFGIPFPRSFSKSKQESLVGKPCQLVHKTGDVDNYVKALMDALRQEDNSVWHVDMRKIWALGEGFIDIQPIKDVKDS